MGYNVLLVEPQSVFLKHILYIPDIFQFDKRADFCATDITTDQSLEGVQMLYVKSSDNMKTFLREVLQQQTKSLDTFQQVWNELRALDTWKSLHSAFFPRELFPMNLYAYNQE